ncbi:MAG: ATP-binding protein [Armatimonadota bacterium]
MNITFRWKVTLAFTALAAVIFLLLDLSLQAAVSQQGVAGMRGSLLAETRLAQRLLPSPPWVPSPALQRLVTDLDHAAQARVTLIEADGTVAADSRDNPAAMENHAYRPERQQALGQEFGSAVRRSATEKIDMLYLALAWPTGSSEPRPVLRLARPMTEVRAATQRLREAIWIGFALAAVLVWLLGLLLSNNLTAPIDTLVRVARRVDKGDLQARVEDVHGPDLGELASVFNSAVDSLAHAVSTSQRESRYYAAILEQMSDAVVIIDHQGRVEFTNPTFARLFGIEGGTAAGRTSEELALNYELSALLLRAIEHSTVQRDEVRLLYPEPRILATAVTPLMNEQQEVVGAIGLLRDVTDLHRLDEMRREFVANASHELRTPAAAVKALAEALQMGALTDPNIGPRFVQQIVDAADRQTTLLDDMLTLTRVERGRELLNIAPLNAAEACGEAVRQLTPAAKARGVNLTMEVRPDEIVTADASGLHTVLLNLLDNAVKYTPRDGSVKIAGRAVTGGYEVCVTDTGIGIPEGDQARVFERFYRVDKARDRATGGTGLGLSIVKHLVEAHGGRVSLRSAPGEGSAFTVSFPSAVVSA